MLTLIDGHRLKEGRGGMIPLRRKHILLLGAAFFLWLGGEFSPAFALTEDEKNNVSIYQKASPSVVNVTSTVITRDFFLNPIPREGSGSGSIIDTRGHILTNNHVIRDAQKLEVTLADGSKWPAKLIGTDPDTDLAVIKINSPPEKIKPLAFGDSQKLRVGQKVLAIGNPFGLGLTLTTGIISSLGRTIRSEVGTTIEDVIQTDASINPGNSGGPLLNSEGAIIGVNTAILSPTGVSVGIGFAIPVNTARRVSSELITKGFVSYPFLGATIHTILPPFAEALRLKVEKGAMVVEVTPGGPADKAGLKGANKQAQIGNFLHPVGGDIIIQMDKLEVTDGEELVKFLRERKVGDTITLKIIRDEKSREVKVTLQERPRDFRRKK